MKNNIRPSLIVILGLSSFFLISFESCQKTEVIKKPPFTLDIEGARTITNIDPKVLLGSKIFNDPNLSVSGIAGQTMVQSCASCHNINQGFAGFGTKSLTTGSTTRQFVGGFAEGAVQGVFGDRIAPSAAYATFSPKLNLPAFVPGPNGTPIANVENEFFGGLFWDGRASGYRLNDPAAEQAQGPFLSTAEQNHPKSIDVLLKIQQNLNGYYNNTKVQTLWEKVWGTPLNVTGLLPSDPRVQIEYDRLGYSIAAFEASKDVSKFSSRFDDYNKASNKKGILTATELAGMNLFTLHCGGCHSIVNANAGAAPLFTDFGYDNIGIFPTKDHPTQLNGTPPVDLGLGAFLLNSGVPAWVAVAATAYGKFKTPTLRNVAKGEVLPNGNINRRYMHNGVLTSLEQVVHYYNTRSVPGAGWSKAPLAGQDPRLSSTNGFELWPDPEFPATFNAVEIGNMGMTTAQELQIVAFLKTLSDR